MLKALTPEKLEQMIKVMQEPNTPSSDGGAK
jgi:hypothetical protein